jgi:predicted nucleic acid-binding Zn ribbon protein
MRCRACGFGNPSDHRFCQECGETLSPPVADVDAAESDARDEACLACGTLNPADYRFCSEFGVMLGARGPGEDEPHSSPGASATNCGSCGYANPADYRFCEECGHEIASVAEPAADRPQQIQPPVASAPPSYPRAEAEPRPSR